MGKIKLSPQQLSAVTHRGSNVLVSAAAGSGKTRVLTERLMSYITDEKAPRSIDSFLIITYTRTAAAELRSRILEELSIRCAKEPENKYLRRQSTLCYRAQIGTIHSICAAILRENCHRLGLLPDFRVGDNDKCDELRQRALKKTLDAAYESIDTLEGFSDLVYGIGAGQDDSRLERTLLDLHRKMQSHPYPEKWAKLQVERMDMSRFNDVGETIWGTELINNAKTTVKYWLNRLDGVWFALCENTDENAPILKAYGDSLSETMDAMRHLLRALDTSWDEAYKALPIPFPNLKALKNYEFEDRKAAFTTARDGCKDAMAAMAAAFDAPSVKLMREMELTAPSMRSLLSLCLEFDKAYTAEKRSRNLLDFSDLEHLALALLRDETSGAPTETAREISKRYTEIMVDEYQDVSAVQDLIFRAISRDDKNIFMVGDIKQSIYRFRLADPRIFINKYHSYADLKNAQEGEAVKISLQQNFRSEPGILDACNHVFSNIMSEPLGEINYDKDAKLIPPVATKSTMLHPPDSNPMVCYLFSQDDENERISKTMLEAGMLAHEIKTLVESRALINEGGIERPIRYGDIAILLRSPGAAGSAFSRALRELGLPVAAQQGGGFFKSHEIVSVLALLSVIDNPYADIPLIAALTSPIFGFTADELTNIRSTKRDGSFFESLRKYAHESAKSSEFLDALSELRTLSSSIGVHELLAHAYKRFEIPAVYAATKSGANLGVSKLMILLELASAFEESGYRSLYSFLKFIERMSQRGEEPRISSPCAGNAVTIMSIHKSKGLEFPVVFLANTAQKFNTIDLRQPAVIHPDLGLGIKLTDLDRGIEYPTIAQKAIKSRLNFELLSEEMRLLYVAMTRAKSRLYISCAVKDPADLRQKLSKNLSSPLSPEILKAAPSMSHWLLSTALLESGGLIEIKPKSQKDRLLEDKAALKTQTAKAEAIGSDDLAEASRILSFTYPHKKSTALPSKLTATSLPHEDSDLDALPLTKRYSDNFRLPVFMDETDKQGEKHPVSPAERGISTHIVMQHIDFSRTGSLPDIQSEIEKLLSRRLLTVRQAKSVDEDAVLRFFSSETGKRIKNAKKVMREFRFSLLCPAEEFFDDAKGEGEKILIQGVVDCCIDEGETLTIIDYKTDHVKDQAQALSVAAMRYKSQIKAYALAMARINDKPVSSCLLCFVSLGLVVELDGYPTNT